MKKTVGFITLFLPVLMVAQPYNIKKLGVEQGLSNNYVVGITQDKQGFLWFATEEGLNKFDGTGFVTYYKHSAPGNTQSITGNELNCIYADPVDPIIWIATQRAGLNAYNYKDNAFTVYASDSLDVNGLITNDVTNITGSSDGNLWLSTYHRGVDYLNKKSGEFTHYNQSTVPELPNNVWTAVDDGEGKLYIGHVNSGLSILFLKDKKVKRFIHDPQNPAGLPGNEVRCIFIDKTGNVWVGTNNGLALYIDEKEEFVVFKNNPNNSHSLLSNYIYSILQLEDNKLWIATEFNGISVLDLKQGLFMLPEQAHFQQLKHGDDNQSLSNSSVRSLFQDSFGNIWIGTWGGGINFISREPPLFNTWSYSPIQTKKTCLSGKVAGSVCTDEQDRLWIGTDEEGINVFKKGERVAIYKKETGELSSNSILAAFRDSENNIWLGTFLGSINYYNTKQKQFSTVYPKGKTKLDVRCFYEDARRNVWIGSNEGLFMLNLTDKDSVKHYSAENYPLPENLIRSIAQDSKERLWIGTFGGGIGIYTSDLKKIELFNGHKGFCSNTINHIYKDSKNRMWVATGEGLVCFPSMDTLTYQVFQRNDGLANAHIRAITEDKNGNIWFSTNGGISCYLADRNCFYNYDHFDEVPIGNFMSGAVAQDKNGIIYFCSINGVCHFNPQVIVSERITPKAVITEIKVFGRLSVKENSETIVPFKGDHKIELNHAQNSFSITFNVQDYSLVKQVEYTYMLQGLENSWYTMKNNNSVTYRNIPPGDYKFRIKVRIRNQEWPEEITMLSLRINPPLWLTWWAKLLGFLFLTGLLYILLLAYKKKIDFQSSYELEKKNREQEQELNNERLRFYTNVTHELRTPLTLILGPLEDMRKDETLSQKQVQKVSVIHQSCLRLLNLINQILEFRKTETQNKKLCVSKADITALINEIGFKYKELNRKPAIDFHINMETNPLILFFDKEIVTTILDNLISNAIKYTEKGAITLTLYAVKKDGVDYIEIIVSDTGYGMSPEVPAKIFDRYYQEGGKHQVSGTGIGLALVKNLVNLHEGEIRVESKQNEGSTFYFSLLTHNTYPNAIHSDLDDKEPEEIKEEEEEAESSGTGKRILLVVEDEEDIRNYIVDSFSDSFEVITAENGEQGVESALKSIPDIIVSDVMMPIMNGTSLCEIIKKDVRTSHIPVILLTVKDSLQDKEEGYRAGADSYLTKPFSATLLHSRINNLLDLRKKLALQLASDSVINNKRMTMTKALNKLDNEFIEKVTQLIEDKLNSEKIDITYISDKMCMSNSTLYRKMKALSGLSTNEYIRKVKMQNAERLLLEGKYNISEIAYRVGINSTAYFRQCFKEEFGVVPTDYLKQIKE